MQGRGLPTTRRTAPVQFEALGALRCTALVPALGVLLVSMLVGCQGSAPRVEGNASLSSGSAQASCGESKIAPFVTPTTLFDSTPSFEVEAVRFADDDSPHRCVVVEDLDGDGFVDLLRAQLPPKHAEGNTELLVAWGPLARGAVTWTRVATLAGDGTQDVPGACVASDVDGDGDLDVLVGGLDRVDLLENSGGRQFALHDEVVDFPAEMNELSVAGVLIPLPFDAGSGSGKLVDLVVGTDATLPPCSVAQTNSELSVEGGDLQWRITLDWPKGLLLGYVGQEAYKWTPAPQGKMPAPEAGMWLSGALGDLDGDGAPELLFARDFDVNEVWGFEGGGRWTVEQPSPIPLPYNHGMGALIEDLDGDGCMEVYVSDFGLDQFYVSNGRIPLESMERDEAVGIQAATARVVSWGSVGADFDSNGLDDVFVVSSLVASSADFRSADGALGPCSPAPGAQWNLVLVQVTPRRFGAVPLPHDDSTVPSIDPASAASGDLDGDGDIDVVTLEQGLLRIHWNVARRAGHWLEVRPLDERGVPCVGARVLVRSDDGYERSRWLWGHYGTCGHSELLAHFGLGSEAGPVRVEVTWPDASETVLEDQSVDRAIVVRKSAQRAP